MFKPFVLVVSIAAGISLVASPLVVAQSKDEVIRLYSEAETLALKGQTDEDLRRAAAKYVSLLKLYEKSQFLEGQAMVYSGLGVIAARKGLLDEAMQFYEAGLSISKKVKDPKLDRLILDKWRIVGRMLYVEAKALQDNLKRTNEDVKRAGGKYEVSLGIFGNIKDEKSVAEVTHNLGLIYRDTGQYSKAADFLEKCLAYWKGLGDTEGQGLALSSLGTTYALSGHYSKAVECLEKSLFIRKRLGDPKGEGDVLNNLGVVHKDGGAYGKAEEHFEKALALFRQQKDLKSESYTLNNLGWVYADWGRYPEALDAHEKSLAIKEQLGDLEGQGFSLHNLGVVCQHIGQNRNAVKWYTKALESYRKAGEPRMVVDTMVNMGLVYTQMGEHDSAAMCFWGAKTICESVGLPVDRLQVHLGELMLDKGELQIGGNLIKTSGYPGPLGRLHLLESNFHAAWDAYAGLLESAEKSGDAGSLVGAHTGLGAAHEAMGDDSKAIEHYKMAMDLTGELRSRLGPAEKGQFFDVRIEGFYRTAPYKGLARVLMRTNKPIEALKRSEYTKARVFAEALSRWSEGKGLDITADVLKTDSELSDKLAALKKARQKGYEQGNQEVISTLDPQVKDLEGKLNSHVARLRKNYPLFAATKYPEPMDLGQTSLKANEWVLEYDVTDSGLLIYLTEGKKIIKALFKPVPKKEIDGLIREFRKTVELAEGETPRDKAKQFDFATGKKLADLLVSDVLPDLPPNVPLIIVPDEQLGVIPFEMLVLNDGGRIASDKGRSYVTGAEFFGDRNPISYYQSITALTLARTLRKQQKPGERLLALVDPVFSRDDPRLAQYDKQRKQKLLDTLPTELLMAMQTENQLQFPRLELTSKLGESLKAADPPRTDLYVGMEAQKSILLEKDLTGYRSLVFGTHGYFGNALAGIQEPVLSLTLIGQLDGKDGFLRMSEVTKLKMNCEIVALTACQSGLGHQISGEGTMGMGRAFQYAGAKSVLMSLWSVAEKSSVQLVENFFKYMKEGKTKLEALRLARDEIRKAGYDHPFYWAPFILVGEVE